MGRRNRGNILFDGCWAHVISRAADKRYILKDYEDFEKFKALLRQSKKQFSYRIHHYRLMHTHFHLAVSVENAPQFSEGLKWAKWSYARYFNLREQRFGPLWRDRFKSLLIEDTNYLMACGRYIEGNPVEAGMVNRSEDWPHSSSRYYTLNQADELVDPYIFDGGPIKITGSAEEYFTRGHAIGSELFKIHCQEIFFKDMPVPR